MLHRRVRYLIVCFLAFATCGCVAVGPIEACRNSTSRIADPADVANTRCPEGPRIDRPTLQDLVELSAPARKAVVAVYSFLDLTGQRKSADNMALFSTAVTQGADSFLIEALQNAGGGTWFTVAERGMLDHLTRERQLIISTRSTYDGEGDNQLKPLLFAGLLMEGGIISYSTNTFTGGVGARYLGIGTSRQHRRDQVTVSLRAVLVQTGEVLLNVLASKTIFSASTGIDTFRFTENGVELVELETGVAVNETAGYAVRSAIEAAVYELIMQGIERDLWDYQSPEEG